MKNPVPFLLLALLIVQASFVAQNQNSKWYFGKYAGIDFMTYPPASITNSSMRVLEGCAAISDPAGNLLFYTSGDTIWNQQHLVLANGIGLFGTNTSAQSSLIIKKPGSTSLYYIFTIHGAAGFNGFNYSIVDMSLAAGMGSVTVKNATLATGFQSEKLSATKHCNGIDFWILTHEYNSNLFRANLLTAAGVSPTPVISAVGTVQNNWAGSGYMKISPSGRKIGLALYNPLDAFELYDFDNTTGAVSNPLALGSFTGAYGCEFSPDGTKFYGSCYNPPNQLLQWNVCAGSSNAIVGSLVSVYTSNCDLGAMQLAPDGKIYIARNNQTMLGVINNPNVAGTGCNYVDQGQSIFPHTSNIGLPNMINDFRTAFSYTLSQSCLTASFTSPVNPLQTNGCNASGNSVTGISWNFGDPLSGPGNTSTLVSPAHTYPAIGIYTVTLILTKGSCASDTIRQSISIGNYVAAVTPSGSCNGLSTAVLVNLNPGGSNSYTWMPTGQASSLATNLSPGVYTVTIKSSGGCTSTKTVTISPPVQISAAITTTLACQNLNTAMASVSVTGGSGVYVYAWNGAGQSWPSTGYLAPGIHTLMVTDGINLCTLSQTFQISYLPSPTISIAGNTLICAGQTANLIANGANTYSWSNNISGPLITVSPSTTISYTVTGTNTLGSCFSIKVVTVSISPCIDVAEQENSSQSLEISPNPCLNTLTIQIKVASKIILYNQLGCIVKEVFFQAGKHYLDIEDLVTGLYILKAINPLTIKTIRLIKL